MELWDATYGQKGARGILMSFIQGTKARELASASQSEQLRFVGSGNSGRWIPEILAPSPETLAV